MRRSNPPNRVELKLLRNGLVQKHVYAFGHRQTIYTGCPDPADLTFQSPMVNDFNQDLCGGWHRSDVSDGNAITFERVIAGLKPLGNIGYWERNTGAKRLDQFIERIKSLDGSILFERFMREIHTGVDCLDFCQRGTLGQLFDMGSLANDYERFLPDIVLGDQIRSHASMPLSAFLHDNWDEQGWLTGLILGYPIENTMSRYYGSVKALSRRKRSRVLLHG